MEEVRLQMTVEANIHLIKSGFSVDTAELEQLVESLKAAQKQAEEMIFGKAEWKETGSASGALRDTLATVKALGGMPAALIGKFAFQGRVQIGATVSAAYSEKFTLENATLNRTIRRLYRTDVFFRNLHPVITKDSNRPSIYI